MTAVSTMVRGRFVVDKLHLQCMKSLYNTVYHKCLYKYQLEANIKAFAVTVDVF